MKYPSPEITTAYTTEVPVETSEFSFGYPYVVTTHVYTAEDVAKDKNIFILQQRINELEEQLRGRS